MTCTEVSKFLNLNVLCLYINKMSVYRTGYYTSDNI